MASSTKVRLRFAKRGDVRLVSHHDLMRCLERMLRRASVPVAHSQGFNPRPRVVFAQALGLGIEGRREVVEIELAEPLEPAELLGRLASVSPPGLDWLEAEDAGAARGPARVAAIAYALELPADRRAAAGAALDRFLASESWPFTRRKDDRERVIDLRPFVLGAAIDGSPGTLHFRLRMAQDGSARAEEVVDALGLRDLLAEQGAVLVRTDVELAPAPPQSGPDRPDRPAAAAPEGGDDLPAPAGTAAGPPGDDGPNTDQRPT